MRALALGLLMAITTAAERHESLVMRDVTGVVQQPLEPGPGKLTALFFVTTDCPISNYYASEIRRICTLEAGRVHCFLIYTDPGLSVAEIQKHQSDVRHGDYPAIFDSKHTLVKAMGASVTPETVLLDAAGRKIYQGRIDDSYASLGKRRAVVGERNLLDAISEALAGKAVTRPRTQATGCSITPVELLQQIRRVD